VLALLAFLANQFHNDNYSRAASARWSPWAGR
jgi:hypothetical protein